MANDSAKRLQEQLLRTEKKQVDMALLLSQMKIEAINAGREAGVTDYGINEGLSHLATAEEGHSIATLAVQAFHEFVTAKAEKYGQDDLVRASADGPGRDKDDN